MWGLTTQFYCKRHPNAAGEGVQVTLALDGGAQRSYISKKVQDALHLKAVKQEGLLINLFGNALDELRTVDLVELTAYSIFDDFQVDVEAFAVDVICSKIQSYDLKKVYYAYLSGLKFCRSD